MPIKDSCVCVCVCVVAKSHLTLCDPIHSLLAPLSTRFPRKEYWSGLPFPSPRDLSNPGIKPRSPELQADSLPTELQGNHCRFVPNFVTMETLNEDYMIFGHLEVICFNLLNAWASLLAQR